MNTPPRITLPLADAIALADIPAMIAALAALQSQLAARLLAAQADAAARENGSSDHGELLDGKALAARFHVPESWIASEGRAGRLPVIKLGKYTRFRPSDVEAALRRRMEREAIR